MGKTEMLAKDLHILNMDQAWAILNLEKNLKILADKNIDNFANFEDYQQKKFCMVTDCPLNSKRIKITKYMPY